MAANNNGGAAATTGAVLPDRQLVAQGMEAFRRGLIEDSIAKFDASVPPGTPAYLWQRGLSYYYNDDFAKGSHQFRDDVLRSPLDVEEIVWDAACLMRLETTLQQQQSHVTFPPPNMLALPPGQKDRRPIMGTVYRLFRGEATEHDLAQVGHRGGPADEFYALFYLGLFNEALGQNSKAESYMRSAATSTYAKAVGSRDYMVDCATVHCQLRHWTI